MPVNELPAVTGEGAATKKDAALPGLTTIEPEVPAFADAVTVSEVVSAL